MGRKRIKLNVKRADEEQNVDIIDEIVDICNGLRNKNIDLSKMRFTPMRNAVEDRWGREFESTCRKLKRSRADLSRIGIISKFAKEGY